MPYFLIVLTLWLVVTGLVRALAPALQLDVEKKHRAKDGKSQTIVPDAKRLKQIRISGVVRLAAIIIIFFAMGVTMTISNKPIPPADLSELEKLLHERGAEFIRRGKTSGLTIAAISGGRDAVVHIGYSNLALKRPVTDETLFEIGSITKVFTGIALAHHVEAGEFKLDQTAASLLPKNFELSAEADSVTLRQLTTHTSGFPRMPGRPRPWDIFKFIVFGGDPYVGITLDRFGEALRKVNLEFTPGSRMEYSNFGVSLLGWLLAQRSGTNYESYIRSRVLEPLGMKDTHIVLPEPSKLSAGYRSVTRLGPLTIASRSKPWNLADHLAGAGALRSNGQDMLKFLKANMNPATNSLGAAIRRSHQELFRVNRSRAIAMNWIRSRKSTDASDIIWHNGGTGGFRSFLGFFEDRSAGIIVLSNSGTDVDSLAMDLLRELAKRKPAAR